MSKVVVVDTNVMVSALLNPDSAPRVVLGRCFDGRCQPLMGNALMTEIETVYGRDSVFKQSLLSGKERLAFLDLMRGKPGPSGRGQERRRQRRPSRESLGRSLLFDVGSDHANRTTTAAAGKVAR